MFRTALHCGYSNLSNPRSAAPCLLFCLFLLFSFKKKNLTWVIQMCLLCSRMLHTLINIHPQCLSCFSRTGFDTLGDLLKPTMPVHSQLPMMPPHTGGKALANDLDSSLANLVGSKSSLYLSVVGCSGPFADAEFLFLARGKHGVLRFYRQTGSVLDENERSVES